METKKNMVARLRINNDSDTDDSFDEESSDSLISSSDSASDDYGLEAGDVFAQK